MSDFSVIVIGAGLGGLCLAQGLRRAGIACEVYERDESSTIRGQGYRIHIDGDGDTALKEMLPPNLHELFRATSGVPQPNTPIFTDQLVQVGTVGSESSVDLNVNRLTLRQILLGGLEDAVHFGKRFLRYETGEDGRITAHFADGTLARADVLVGADGVGSVVRAQYLPHARVIDTGLRQLYAKIPLTPATRELFDDTMYANFSMILGPAGTMLGVAPVEYPEPVAQAVARLAPGVLISDSGNYMTCSFTASVELLALTDEELFALSGKELQALALGMMTEWAPGTRAMVEHWETETVFPLALRTSVPIPHWETTNVTLLGDAIHAMSPAAGVGANTALRDASLLVTSLVGRPVLDGLQRYEKAMVDYGFDAVRLSAANVQRFLKLDTLPVS
jgi:2-polyprenyl-6-methoxyphenol hydroxylase-like FAD-dependent oxidoreductase